MKDKYDITVVMEYSWRGLTTCINIGDTYFLLYPFFITPPKVTYLYYQLPCNNKDKTIKYIKNEFYH